MKTVSLENKLQHILDNAVNNSPYYSKLRGIVDVTDIKSFPLLKKTDVKILSLCKLFLDDEHLNKYYSEIMKFRPNWLFFQPSVFMKLTDFILKNKLQLPLFIKYVEFTGETLNSLAVDYVNQYYKCSYSNMYGTTETGTIGYMCPCGNMHVLNDNVYLEVIQEQQYCSTETGKAIVTSLNNNIFPLIRYDIGDIITVDYCNNCGCGLRGQIIKEIIGRKNKCVTLDDGKIISESTVVSIFDRVNTLTDNKVKEYKAIINNELSTIDLIMYIDSKYKFWEKEILNNLKKVISTRFNFVYKAKFMYEPLSVNSNGKFSVVEVI